MTDICVYYMVNDRGYEGGIEVLSIFYDIGLLQGLLDRLKLERKPGERGLNIQVFKKQINRISDSDETVYREYLP